MKVFIFQADLICAECAAHYKQNNAIPRHVLEGDESSYDSNDWPTGPYSNGGGEADSPQHCGMCNVFLQNPLTPHGVEYVREKLADFIDDPHCGNSDILAQWRNFYRDIL